MDRLSLEIEDLVIDRMAVEFERPGFFWGDNGRTLSMAEAGEFGIGYDEFLRMITVLEAWYDFMDWTWNGPIFHSPVAIAAARAAHPGLLTGDLAEFIVFAALFGRLDRRQALAIYRKDEAWTERELAAR